MSDVVIFVFNFSTNNWLCFREKLIFTTQKVNLVEASSSVSIHISMMHTMHMFQQEIPALYTQKLH